MYKQRITGIFYLNTGAVIQEEVVIEHKTKGNCDKFIDDLHSKFKTILMGKDMEPFIFGTSVVKSSEVIAVTIKEEKVIQQI